MMRRPLLARRSDQRGLTLIEVLVAVAVLMITATGLMVAIITSMRVSAEANLNARMNVLTTAYGEAIKNLPFEQCATTDQYNADFQGADAWPAESASLQLELDAVLSVRSVVPATVADGCRTAGTQTVQISVESNGRERLATISKRDPKAAYAPMTVTLDITDNTPDNSAQTLWTISASVEPPEFNYVYRWFCNPVADFETMTVDPGTPESSQSDFVDCLYPSTPQGQTEQLQHVGVEVTGPQGTIRRTTSRNLGLTSASLLPPNVSIAVSNTPTCAVANECFTGHESQFESLASSPSGSVVRWSWEVTDGSTPIDCYGTGCDSFSHEFEGGGTFVVSLRVWDSWGQEAVSNGIPIVISSPPRLRPTATLTANPSYTMAKNNVVLDGSQSHGGGSAPGTGIQTWLWDCGNGQTTSGAGMPTFTCYYANPGTYTATLFVIGTNGATNEAQQQIRVAAFAAPTNFTHSANGKGDIWLIRNAYFDFAWTNPDRAPGDTLTLEINIGARSGVCGVLGVGLDGRRFSVPMGAAGSSQSYRAQFSSSPRGFSGVCSTDSFTYQVRIARQNAIGTTYSDWSPPRDVDVDFF